MTLLHIGYIVCKYAGKPIIELVLERYASHLVKSAEGYLAFQIDAMCHDGKIIHDSYATRLRHKKGYYTLEETIKKIENGQSELTKDMIEFGKLINEGDDDLVIVDDV
jgi:hypothetical protein